MLALPVNAAEEESDLAPAPVTITAASFSSSPPTLDEPHAQIAALPDGTEVALPAGEIKSVREHGASAVGRPHAPALVASAAPGLGSPTPPPVTGWLRPLVVVNRAFDRGTLRLGAVGCWLRRPRGRQVLGWTGLLLLAAALARVILDWIGWTW
jgi:hypothetical protein